MIDRVRNALLLAACMLAAMVAVWAGTWEDEEV